MTDQERDLYSRELIQLHTTVPLEQISNRVIHQDLFEVVDYLPLDCVDLLFVDPPYNLTKDFFSGSFKRVSLVEYEEWIESWLSRMVRVLKPTASVYICSDWRSSSAVHKVAEKYLQVRNRITFERDKGRGAMKNWKNNSEDVWFCTVSNDYYFDVESVKLKRKVIAPYRENGRPKDWMETNEGDYRLTFPANIWTDISIPFWSMPENTPHPTQKPEKLLAKIILASSREDDLILDFFAGVGTTGVVAKKLNRRFVMVEIEREYCLYAIKRLKAAEADSSIQGYYGGVFWERNTLPRTAQTATAKSDNRQPNPDLERNTRERYHEEQDLLF